jgi:hypothetical protein
MSDDQSGSREAPRRSYRVIYPFDYRGETQPPDTIITPENEADDRAIEFGLQLGKLGSISAPDTSDDAGPMTTQDAPEPPPRRAKR